jgi:Zinc-finger of C2H2 type
VDAPKTTSTVLQPYSECSICLTQHTNESLYIAHLDTAKHQANLKSNTTNLDFYNKLRVVISATDIVKRKDTYNISSALRSLELVCNESKIITKEAISLVSCLHRIIFTVADNKGTFGSDSEISDTDSIASRQNIDGQTSSDQPVFRQKY